MLAYGNIILSGKHFLILGNIVLDGFLVFAVGGNQHVCTVEVFSRLFILSTSMFPVLEPMNSLMPQTRCLSSLPNSL